MTHGPSPATHHPISGADCVAFLKHFITRLNIEVGDYTYYDDPASAEWFEENVLYHFDFIGDRLVIGKLCSIATGVRFLMNGGHHHVATLSSYPFSICRHEPRTARKRLARLSVAPVVAGSRFLPMQSCEQDDVAHGQQQPGQVPEEG